MTQEQIKNIAIQLDFDIEDVEMLMEAFSISSIEIMGNLKVAIEENNFDDIFYNAHSLKGSSSNLLLDDIAEISAEIEKQSKEKNNINYLDKYNKLELLLKDA